MARTKHTKRHFNKLELSFKQSCSQSQKLLIEYIFEKSKLTNIYVKGSWLIQLISHFTSWVAK